MAFFSYEHEPNSCFYCSGYGIRFPHCQDIIINPPPHNPDNEQQDNNQEHPNPSNQNPNPQNEPSSPTQPTPNHNSMPNMLANGNGFHQALSFIQFSENLSFVPLNELSAEDIVANSLELLHVNQHKQPPSKESDNSDAQNNVNDRSSEKSEHNQFLVQDLNIPNVTDNVPSQNEKHSNEKTQESQDIVSVISSNTCGAPLLTLMEPQNVSAMEVEEEQVLPIINHRGQRKRQCIVGDGCLPGMENQTQQRTYLPEQRSTLFPEKPVMIKKKLDEILQKTAAEQLQLHVCPQLVEGNGISNSQEESGNKNEGKSVNGNRRRRSFKKQTRVQSVSLPGPITIRSPDDQDYRLECSGGT